MNKLRVAVMGCTGIVGQQFVRMLDGHPYFEVSALFASNRSEGKRYCDAVDWIVSENIPECVRDLVIMDASVEAVKKMGVGIVFSALPTAVAKDIENALRREGVYVFSNASAHRMDNDVPMLIPEVNPTHLELVEAQISRYGGFIVTNSNCSTTGLVMALKPLLKRGLNSVIVTTYQALSGAGRRGVASLDILGNIIPYIKGEEEKIERETIKILGNLHHGGIRGADIEVNASCCRIPVKDGHLESVIVELDEDLDIETISKTLSSFKGIPQDMRLPTAPEAPIILRTEDNRPQPALDVYAGAPERAKGMAITVGRIRKKDNRINFFLLVHNTIRGAAGTCILNAELAVEKNYI
jgi:aspartate-semialdehyde dehydrogenase